MDHQLRRLARLLGEGLTRRAGLRAIAAALPVAAAVGADAKSGHQQRGSGHDNGAPGAAGPCGPKASDNKCRKDKECCTGYCKPGQKGKAGRCRCVATGKECSAGQLCCGTGTCTNGRCTKEPVGPSCTAATCPYGCCLNDVCQSAANSQTTASCGTAGGACEVCTSGDICFAGVCGTWTYQGRFGAADNMGEIAGLAISADGLTVAVNDMNSNTVFVSTRPARTSTTWTLQSQFSTLIDGQTVTSASFGIAMSPDLKTIWAGNNVSQCIAIWTRPSASSTTWTYQDKFGSTVDTPDVEGIVVPSDTLTLWSTDYTAENVSVWTRPNTSTWAFTKSATFGNNTDTAFPIQSGVTADTLTVLAPSNQSFVSVYTRPSATSTAWTKSTTFGDAVTAKNACTVMVSAGGTASLVLGGDGVNAWTCPGTWTWQTKAIAKGSGDDELTDPLVAAMTPDGWVAVFSEKGAAIEVAVWNFE
ncbi:MAG: hypothetical protein ACR2J8_13815 [Thermomicrobiales bacterium]